MPTLLMSEKHYTPDELAKLWHVSGNTVRRMFHDVDGVMLLDRAETMHKRAHCSMRIPASVAQRIYEQYTKSK